MSESAVVAFSRRSNYKTAVKRTLVLTQAIIWHWFNKAFPQMMAWMAWCARVCVYEDKMVDYSRRPMSNALSFIENFLGVMSTEILPKLLSCVPVYINRHWIRWWLWVIKAKRLYWNHWCHFPTNSVFNFVAVKCWIYMYFHIWELRTKKHLSTAWTNNYFPQYSVRCVYLHMICIHVSRAEVFICLVNLSQALGWVWLKSMIFVYIF